MEIRDCLEVVLQTLQRGDKFEADKTTTERRKQNYETNNEKVAVLDIMGRLAWNFMGGVKWKNE